MENTHFNLQWGSIEDAIYKCVLSNLSDLNAMGAKAEWALLGICLNKSWGVQEQEKIVSAFQGVLKKHQVGILGGDTVSGDIASFQLTVFGRTPDGEKALLRSGAQPGENLYVTGELGASKAGLWALEHGVADKYPQLVRKHLLPEPPLALGPILHKHQVGACIDLSDGLSSEMTHIALQSGVKIEVDADKIPLAQGLEAFSKKNKLSALNLALHGGEEYQLLFTSKLPESLLILYLQVFKVTFIGRITKGEGVFLNTGDKGLIKVQPKVWSNL